MRIEDDFEDNIFISPYTSNLCCPVNQTDARIQSIAMNRINNDYPKGEYEVDAGFQFSFGGSREPEYQGYVRGRYSDDSGLRMNVDVSQSNDGRVNIHSSGGYKDSFPGRDFPQPPQPSHLQKK